MDLFFVWWLWVLHFCGTAAATTSARLRACALLECRLSAVGCGATVYSWICVQICVNAYVRMSQVTTDAQRLKGPRMREPASRDGRPASAAVGFCGQNGSRLQLSRQHPQGRLPSRRLPVWRQMIRFPSELVPQGRTSKSQRAEAYLTRAQVHCCLKSLIISRRARKPRCDSSWQQ